MRKVTEELAPLALVKFRNKASDGKVIAFNDVGNTSPLHADVVSELNANVSDVRAQLSTVNPEKVLRARIGDANTLNKSN